MHRSIGNAWSGSGGIARRPGRRGGRGRRKRELRDSTARSPARDETFRNQRSEHLGEHERFGDARFSASRRDCTSDCDSGESSVFFLFRRGTGGGELIALNAAASASRPLRATGKCGGRFRATLPTGRRRELMRGEIKRTQGSRQETHASAYGSRFFFRRISRRFFCAIFLPRTRFLLTRFSEGKTGGGRRSESEQEKRCRGYSRQPLRTSVVILRGLLEY